MNSTTLAPLFSHGSRLLVRAAFPLALGLFASAVPAYAQKIATIAHYTFSDSASLFRDSGGNGFNLSPNASFASHVAQSTTVFSNASSNHYSVYFDGSQTGSANRQINFSTYTALTFDWHMKVDPTDLNGTDRTLFQTGYQTDVGGGFGIQLRWNTANESASIYVYHRLGGSGKWAFSTFLVSGISDWNNYTLTIDNSVQSSAGHIVLSVNGVGASALSSTYSTGATGAAFPSSQFSYLVNNGTAANAPFKGYLQDFEIYSGTPIPEPSSAGVLMGLAGTVVVLGSRRHR